MVQRTSSDLRLNPHVHAVFLDGVYSDGGDSVTFHPLVRLSTAEDRDREASGLAALAATAASGMTLPEGPAFRRGTLPLPRSAQDFARIPR